MQAIPLKRSELVESELPKKLATPGTRGDRSIVCVEDSCEWNKYEEWNKFEERERAPVTHAFQTKEPGKLSPDTTLLGRTSLR